MAARAYRLEMLLIRLTTVVVVRTKTGQKGSITNILTKRTMSVMMAKSPMVRKSARPFHGAYDFKC